MTAAAEAALRAERVEDLHRIAAEDTAWASEIRAETRRRSNRMLDAVRLARDVGVVIELDPETVAAAPSDPNAIGRLGAAASRVSL